MKGVKGINWILGKKKESMSIGNRLWVKKFENGVKIRKYKEGEITLNINHLFEVMWFLRHFIKEDKFMAWNDLAIIRHKFPETKELIERLFRGEISFEEQKKAEEEYNKNQERKQNILNNLGEE